MQNGKFEKPSFIFNMSVGYNLEGIKTEKMQKFIDSMIDARKDERFAEYLDELEALLEEGMFEGTPWEGLEKKVKGISKKISWNISPSTTLSTMHGCPPKEIEAICSYMLTDKKVDTFVKLNPTLLGFDTVRKILMTLGMTTLPSAGKALSTTCNTPMRLQCCIAWWTSQRKRVGASVLS